MQQNLPFIASPDPYVLVPPLLACLATASVPSRPPPAIFPLLSPILRQRVHLLLDSPSSSESWTSQLCWQKERAVKVSTVIENYGFEAHPTSGEIELGDVHPVVFRRRDHETLEAGIALRDMGLNVRYVWCVGDGEKDQHGWRVSELDAIADNDTGDAAWYPSMTLADDAFQRSQHDRRRDLPQSRAGDDGTPSTARSSAQTDDNGDEEVYWSQYGRTPATASADQTPPLPPSHVTGGRDPDDGMEDSYYRRYAQVQPVLDRGEDLDPHERERFQPLPHSSEGSGLETEIGMASRLLVGLNADQERSSRHLEFQARPMLEKDEDKVGNPRPISSSSTASAAVVRLEGPAATQSTVKAGIKQHICSSLQSLSDLAATAGMDSEEFDVVVRSGLDMLRRPPN
ncbi:MAG: hypothetical protein M1826_006848 [Phylliscum demangeonii]|nr:MAG: hypothetical protein M1826_006848 [Phylliscum demangeonii]